MKLKRMLYSTLALSILGTAGVSEVVNNVTVVQAKAKKAKHNVQLLKFHTYHKKVMVSGKSGAIYTSYKLKHVRTNLKHYKNKPFQVEGVGKVKLASGKKVAVALITRAGVYGYTKLSNLHAYKESTTKQNQNTTTTSNNNTTANNNTATGTNNGSQSVTSNATGGNTTSYSSSNQTSSSASAAVASASSTTTSSSATSTTSSATTSSSSSTTSTSSSSATSSSSSSTTKSSSASSSTTSSASSSASTTSSSNKSNASSATSSASQSTSSTLTSDAANGTTGNSIVNGNPNAAAIMTALNQINAERQQRGISPYTLNSKLMAIANQRAQQIATRFSHYDSNGNAVYEGLISQSGMNLSTMAENIGMVGDPSLNMSQSFLSDIHDMMYNDADSNWGHRYNFLNSANNIIGIGVYQDANGSFYMAYDMGGTNN